MFERAADIMKDDHSEELRRIAMRRFMFGAVFFVGTVLAAIGWFIEWKGWDQVSVKLQHLTWLALAGHALQVAAAFGLMLLPERDAYRLGDAYSDHETEA